MSDVTISGVNPPSQPLDRDFQAFREIAEVSDEGVLLYHIPRKQISYANSIATALIGLEAGAKLQEIDERSRAIVPNDRQYLTHLGAQMILRGDPTTSAEIVVKCDREPEKIICCNVYRISGGNVLAIFLRDISKSKQHENYLVEFGTRKNTVLDTLTHHISGALLLMRHLTSEAEKSAVSTREENLKVYLGLLQENTTQCIDVINDLLKKEHETSPKVFVKTSRIDLIDKIGIVHNELTKMYSVRQFIFTHPQAPLYITTDDIKLLQVVNNLVSNAVKFSQPEKPVTIAITEDEKQVLISVTDQGIGIPDVLRPMIFQRQIGLGRTGLNGEKSIGLGLSICKNLVTLMGGEIWFESTEGVGSTFCFSLPKN